MSDKVVLDKGTFKALASETRLGLLKNLDGKEVNLSDLSREMSMNKATLLEHLNIMMSSDLVKRVEREGHKFVYYKLTLKGSGILHPERTWVTVMLSGAALAIVGGLWTLMKYMNPAAQNTDTGAPLKAAFESTPMENTANPTMMYISIALFAASVIMICTAAFLYKHKRLELDAHSIKKKN
ncbi:MAG: helix-turn-helix domain-containing protein [Candidatus Thermoplasmatota archaeon]|nr:helix-turn-helix domain-containing protein [Candidatus Thermoplasmatota archaeon]